ncbi:unnamed protein product [Fraxinus pennsylvanica]|uniref:Uncharacterized protein n=1 Tax=Fraxinus pennsylvanica TaxID=56036 RepID=A0AAD2DKM7_9LAMI|nr:unnamed protein product [Fraxinus pennsylvanica]
MPQVKSLQYALFPATGAWHAENSERVFAPVDSAVIMSSPLGRGLHPNKFVWHYEANGAYSVKSRYRLLTWCILQDESTNLDLNDWWKLAWTALAPQRLLFFFGEFSMKLFLHRTFLNMGCEWVVGVDSVASLESTAHILFWFECAKGVSKSLGWWDQMRGFREGDNLREILLRVARRFCQATGHGGTVQRRESVEEKIARHTKDGTLTTREIVVQFNADVADGMPWKFVPTQREVRVKLGESALAFYKSKFNSHDRCIYL